jgi:antitoxin YefM
MQVISLQTAKQELEEICTRACEDYEPYIIHTADKHDVVLISLAEFNAWQETRYLLENPYNARRLLDSLEKARHGQVTAYDLIEQ